MSSSVSELLRVPGARRQEPWDAGVRCRRLPARSSQPTECRAEEIVSSADPYLWFGRAHDLANHSSARGMEVFHQFQDTIYVLSRNTEQQATAGLGIREKGLLKIGYSIPLGELIRIGAIVAAAIRDAVGGDQPENLASNRGHMRRTNFRAYLAGAAHRAKMAKQPKPSHVHG